MKKSSNYIKLEFLSRSTNEGFARSAVAAFASQLDPTLDELGDIKTAVSEAVTNAIVHAYPDTLGKIVVRVRLLDVLVGLSLVVIYLGATYGVLYTSVSNAGFIGAMTVLFTPFFEFVVYRKRPDRKLGFALAVCMAGMALLTLNEALRPAPGDIICLLVPTFYAADLMVTEKAVAKPEVDPIALGVLQTAVAGVCLRNRQGIVILKCPATS